MSSVTKENLKKKKFVQTYHQFKLESIFERLKSRAWEVRKRRKLVIKGRTIHVRVMSRDFQRRMAIIDERTSLGRMNRKIACKMAVYPAKRNGRWRIIRPTLTCICVCVYVFRTTRFQPRMTHERLNYRHANHRATVENHLNIFL